MARKDYPYSKRNLNYGTKLVSNLIAGLIVAPFELIDLLATAHHNLYDESLNEPLSKTTHTRSKEISEKDPQSLCEIMVKNIAKRITNKKYNRIRDNFYDVINLNNKIENEKRLKYLEKRRYNKKLKYLKLIPYFKEKYTEIINNLSREINDLNKSINIPIIKLEDLVTGDNKCIENNSLIFLSINNNIYVYKKIDFRIFPKSIIGTKKFFKIDRNPNSSLSFSSIEFNFYDNFMIIMSRKDFSIVNYKDILIKYRTIKIEPYPSEYFTIFNTCYEKWGRSFVQVTIIELEIFSEKISFIFNNEYNAFEFISNFQIYINRK